MHVAARASRTPCVCVLVHTSALLWETAAGKLCDLTLLGGL